MSIEKVEIVPIGFVERTSPDKYVKDKKLLSKIVLKSGLRTALEGIEDFSHIFVVFWLNKISGSEGILRVHPRARADLPLVGVLATRAPTRPNPIGLTLVELVKRERNVLWVKGLDAFDGTPVLDIKPFDSWDTVINPRIPKWLEDINK